MRRVGLALLFVLGFAAAGGLSAAVVAQTVPSVTTPSVTAPTSTATTTTAPGTTAAPPTTTAPAKPRRPPRPRVLARGVTIAGVRVGGLTLDAAYTVVRRSFLRPLRIAVDDYRVRVSPTRAGAVAYIRYAVRRARTARPGTRIPLIVVVHGRDARAFVARLAEHVDREPVDSQLLLRNLRPYLTEERPGRELDRERALRLIVGALERNSRRPLRVRTAPVAPATTRSSFGAIVVIRRDSKHLDYYEGMRLVRTFGVATGQSVYPTPIGRFSIVVKWRDPWWYPPDSDWAKGLKPVPPGPGNPLGTRWMGLSAPGVGIHGTPDDASIGYSASHGCIRMHIPDAEWLFNHVSIGTTVFIVPA